MSIPSSLFPLFVAVHVKSTMNYVISKVVHDFVYCVFGYSGLVTLVFIFCAKIH